MASPATTETMEIRRRGRRRLIGAVAIVVLLVVFVPMLLDTEQHRSSGGPSTRIPSMESAPPLPAPSPAPAESKPAPAAAPQGQPAQEAPPVARVTPEPSTREPSAPAKPAKPATKPAAPKAAQTVAVPAQAAPRLEGFAVQVGAFHDEQTLRQARAKIALAGVPYYTERIGGGLTRLRAGPFPTREAAEKARASLQQGELHGQVVPLP